ncbi:MAG: Co2+/Mg2+ efflux protein ApaG [Myxococcales bacterium]|nr:Co2+/Mg2+ efflux protein ApaG [Myxococcales bacterium]
MSEALTQGVRVQVRSQYVPERSTPDEDFYFFAYRVRVINEGEVPVKLISRHWIITDGTGHVEEVRGPGVVGAQPLLERGQAFEYTSACPLRTPVGTMHGTYQMLSADGEAFDAEIAPFTLAVPNAIN